MIALVEVVLGKATSSSPAKTTSDVFTTKVDMSPLTNPPYPSQTPACMHFTAWPRNAYLLSKRFRILSKWIVTEVKTSVSGLYMP